MSGAMPYNTNNVDVICQHKMDGSIIPLKIRICDDDGEYQSFVIRGYKDLSHPGGKTLPNEIQVTSRLWTFECKIAVFGAEKIIKLVYNTDTGVWFI